MPEKRFIPPPKPERPDAYLDMHSMNHYQSITKPHVTHHDHLRYFFHLIANEHFPERHIVYSSVANLEATPLKSRGDIGELP